MKIGVVVRGVEGFEPWVPSLLKFFELNPEGSFIQEDVEQGLAVHHGKEEHRASIQMLASSQHGKQMSPAEYLKDQAYAWRCMISHVRDKAVAFANIKAKQSDVSMSIDSKSHPSFLAPICDIVATSIAKKTKQIVKCPFAKFKHLMKASSSDDDDDDDECDDREADAGSLAATAVFEDYSQYFGAAIIRYDSGAIENAVNY